MPSQPLGQLFCVPYERLKLFTSAQSWKEKKRHVMIPHCKKTTRHLFTLKVTFLLQEKVSEPSAFTTFIIDHRSNLMSNLCRNAKETPATVSREKRCASLTQFSSSASSGRAVGLDAWTDRPAQKHPLLLCCCQIQRPRSHRPHRADA